MNNLKDTVDYNFEDAIINNAKEETNSKNRSINVKIIWPIILGAIAIIFSGLIIGIPLVQINNSISKTVTYTQIDTITSNNPNYLEMIESDLRSGYVMISATNDNRSKCVVYILGR